ncbi:hypothetical protein BDV24DRAFT_137843 [Aspergillus arachidicola]|uniref:Uncharacterized protein n=1 Tax=Aspergillus arachidicola TaxID=656916 RepID=A0A5N6XZ72_9EURO|nr:hypothetical protein BDV24DRAFT_137843 [Aspergillus arachidicola]
MECIETHLFFPFSVGHIVLLTFFDAYYIVAVTCVRLNMCSAAEPLFQMVFGEIKRR